MKNLFICMLVFFCVEQKNAFAQWLWAGHLGSNFVQYNEDAQIINDGTNSFLIGSFAGAFFLQNDTIYSNGSNDMYVSKFDANGTVLWTKSFGGYNTGFNDWENARGLYDSTCNCIYLAGHFGGGAATFGAAGSLISAGSADIFIAKMDLNGNFIWAKKAGGPGFDNASIFCSPNGKLYLIAKTSDSAYFGGFHLPAGGSISKYDTNGICTMAKIYYSSPLGSSNSLGVNFINDDLLLYGSFNSSAFFIDTTQLQCNGNFDAFLSRADTLGNIKWIKSFGYSGIDAFQGLAVDDSNYIYVSGGFTDSIDLVGIKLYDTGPDNLYAKFDENGNSIWARQTHATGNIQSSAQILKDKNGNCYFTGEFSGTANFGGNVISTSNLLDVFLTRYSSNGDCMGITNFGEAVSSSISLDNQGYIYIAGDFANTISLGSTTMSSIGGYDLYIAKHSAITGIKYNTKSSNTQLLIHANPNEGKCDITVPDDFLHEQNLVLSIYSSSGKLIQQKNLEMNQNKIKINLEAQAKGLYNAVLSNGTKSYSGKIVFE